MLNKKQLVRVISIAAIIFIIMFGSFYAYFYTTGTKEPIVPEEVVQASSEGTMQPTKEQSVKQEIVILPSTEVTLELYENEILVSTQQIPVSTVMGLSEAKLQEMFQGYTVEVFSAERVVLEEHTTPVKLPPSYQLGVQDEIIGIMGTEDSEFISLNLSTRECPKAAVDLLRAGIPITPQEKQKLQRNPYYIEAILQSYSE